MKHTQKKIEVGGKSFFFDMGHVAKQADGSVLVAFGDSVVLVTVCAGKSAREGVNFLPLTCDYIEKTYAAGKIPGGFFKREARPRDHETLTSRMIDRSIRPLFPEMWRCETQVIATVLSYDPDFASDVCALNGTSMALMMSNIPFAGPIAAVRVGRVDGKLIANPSLEEFENSDLDLFVSCSRKAITMVEGGAHQLAEDIIVDALLFAHESCQPLLDIQEEVRAELGLEKRVAPEKPRDEDLEALVAKLASDDLRAAVTIPEKLARYAQIDVVKSATMEKVAAELSDEDWGAKQGLAKEAFGDLKYNMVRKMIVDEKTRIDGRKHDEIRDIACHVGFLPRVHGSGLFQRGETQGVITCTLGTKQDEQKLEDLQGSSFKRFLLHYNFPPYSVGEVKFLRSPGRREIGHGALAERAIKTLIPSAEEFPYTIRIVSEITESNGSSSMASVCGATLSMLDAGVPLKSATAGIAMGLIERGKDIAILSDILGDEDHLGDMDFKVCGTENGVTAVQMDIKMEGVSREVLESALEQARVGRLHILAEMNKVINSPREDLSRWAPRITVLKIKPERIKDIIGPGGKVIKDIVAKTGVAINVEDDGTVNIASNQPDLAERAIRMVKDITREPEVDKIYLGNVRKIMDFGAFVEIFPGTDGLVHISELADKRVDNVEDVVREGDEVLVKCLSIDRNGKIRLSRKAALGEEVSD
jgi:polyribonucleotide nucleotidyltransferase